MSKSTTTTTTQVFYTDTTPPTAFLGTLKTGIAGFSSAAPDRIKYALYDDATTFAAWLTWAPQNAYDNNAMNNYSTRALQINGYWPTMDLNEKSFMCIADSSTTNAKGALCAEADIGPTADNKTYKVKTYSIPAASVATKLVDQATAYAQSPAMTAATKNYNFDGTVASVFTTLPATTALSNGSQGTGNPSKWEAFDLFKCTATSITITCNNWVRAAGKETDGGYQRWDNGTKVTFWWYDGRDLSDAVKYPAKDYDKIISKAVTLEFQTNPVPAGSVHLSMTLSALSAAVLATLF